LAPGLRNTDPWPVTPYGLWRGILDYFSVNVAPGVYNKSTGALVAAIWRQNVEKGSWFASVRGELRGAESNVGRSLDGNPIMLQSEVVLVPICSWTASRPSTRTTLHLRECFTGHRYEPARPPTSASWVPLSSPLTVGSWQRRVPNNFCWINALLAAKNPGIIFLSISVGGLETLCR